MLKLNRIWVEVQNKHERFRSYSMCSWKGGHGGGRHWGILLRECISRSLRSRKVWHTLPFAPALAHLHLHLHGHWSSHHNSDGHCPTIPISKLKENGNKVLFQIKLYGLSGFFLFRQIPRELRNWHLPVEIKGENLKLINATLRLGMNEIYWHGKL